MQKSEIRALTYTTHKRSLELIRWDDLREEHWNMYVIICEIDCQSRFDA